MIRENNGERMIESQLKVPYVKPGVGVGSARWPIRYVYYEIESVCRKKREKWTEKRVI